MPVPGYPGYPPPGAIKQGSPPPEPPTPVVPIVPAVNPELASRAMQRLLSVELRDIGFDAAEPAALKRLELDVAACSFLSRLIRTSRSSDLYVFGVHLVVERLYQQAHEFANLANRAGPIAKDILLASQECGLQTKELRELADHTATRQKIGADVLAPLVLTGYTEA